VSRRAAAGLLAGLALASAGIGCGGSDEDDDAKPPPRPRPVETSEKLPKLPATWHAYRNRAGGFALGLPRGWKATRPGRSSQIRSYDRLVVMAITPDRARAAVELDPREAATRTIVALPGFAEELEPGRPRAFKHRYPGAEVKAEARTSGRDGVAERVRVIVLRRPLRAVFTIVVAANAHQRSRPAERLALRAIETLRSQPRGAPRG
jgi:hypothetical protein